MVGSLPKGLQLVLSLQKYFSNQLWVRKFLENRSLPLGIESLQLYLGF